MSPPAAATDDQPTTTGAAAATDTAATPLWRQVLEDLERRLASGEISDRFPTDRELGEYYDVSRHTVRQAVGRLTARGIIERQRGRGSTVARPGLLQELGTVYSLYRAVEATGGVQTSDLLGIERCRDADVAATLDLPADAELVRLERLRRVDDEPLALDTAWLPLDVGAPLMEVDFGHTALYDELRTRVGVAPTSGREVITPVVPDEDLRAMLDLDDDEAVLRIVRTSAHDDRPIECRITLIRGSRFAMVSRWPGPTTTEVQVTLPGGDGHAQG
jgi:GntR family transcriptional regulator